MTPTEANRLLLAIYELSTPEGCQPYVNEIWSDAAEASTPSIGFQDPVLEHYSQYQYLRKTLPAQIASTMKNAWDAQTADDGLIDLAEEEMQVLDLACKKRGLMLSAHVTPVTPPQVGYQSVGKIEGETAEEEWDRFVKANAERVALAKQLYKSRAKAPIETSTEAPGTIYLQMDVLAGIANRGRRGGREPS